MNYTSAARKLNLEPKRELPVEKEPKKVIRVKAKVQVHLFAWIGGAIVLMLLLMVAYSFSQYYVTKERVGELNSQLKAEQIEISKLSGYYNSQINLKEIEREARLLGMRKPTSRQMVYITIPGEDYTEKLEVDERNFFERAFDAIVDSFNGIKEAIIHRNEAEVQHG